MTAPYIASQPLLSTPPIPPLCKCPKGVRHAYMGRCDTCGAGVPTPQVPQGVTR